MKKILIAVLAFGLFGFQANAEDGFASTSEAGFTLNDGNDQSQAIALKTNNVYTTGKNVFTLTGQFFNKKNTVKDLISENILAGLRYDRYVSDVLSLYVDTAWREDIFFDDAAAALNGYWSKFSVGAGLRYDLIKSDDTLLFTELGYVFRQDTAVGSVDSVDSHFARWYLEGKQKLTETVDGRLWIEQLLDLENSNNYELTFEPSLDVVLSTNLGLKLAYWGRYDGVTEAAGLKHYDSRFTTTLTAKY